MERFHAHECALANRVLAFLRERGARIIGPEHAELHRRAATIAFVPKRGTTEAVAGHLARRRIAVGGGADFYARRLIEAVGIKPEAGVARVSLVHYNSDADVDRLLEALGEVI
jgi:selenocysteine lyase/cysteine desulfurase